jgi:hypothetical protein
LTLAPGAGPPLSWYSTFPAIAEGGEFPPHAASAARTAAMDADAIFILTSSGRSMI